MNREEKEDAFLRTRFKNNGDIPKEIDDAIETTLNSIKDGSFKNEENGKRNNIDKKKVIKWLAAALVTITIIGVGEKSFDVSAKISGFFEEISTRKIISSKGEEFGTMVGSTLSKDGYDVTLQRIISESNSIKVVYAIKGEKPWELGKGDLKVYINGSFIDSKRASDDYIKLDNDKGLLIINLATEEELPSKYELTSTLSKGKSEWVYKVNIDSTKLLNSTKNISDKKVTKGKNYDVIYNEVVASPMEIKASINVEFKNSSDHYNKNDIIGFVVKNEDGRILDNHLSGSGILEENRISYMLSIMDYDDIPTSLELIPYIIHTVDKDDLEQVGIKNFQKEIVNNEENYFKIISITEDEQCFKVEVKASGELIGNLANTISFIGNNGDEAFLSWSSILNLRNPSSEGSYTLVYEKHSNDEEYKLQLPKSISTMYDVLQENKTNINLR
ncbi:DUF4179 domain-containing protein [Clostridium cadaveris]|uniref:DUF4179 domain-containing protein n=1 Tax=Clostridium cadaveris TaxID=1529 RepID=UPI000C079180|nr:DUF4179 domain-containing protein [Clostridium cadaveris]UFH64089.1 DUF4179 domain-containing protein [Clostridium cadaveris]